MAQPTSTITEQDAKIVRHWDVIPSWRWISTYLTTIADSNDMAVDGSGGAPQSFSYTPPVNYDFIASRLIMLMITSSAMSLAVFADLAAALGTGIQFVADGVLIATWQSNIDMYTEYYDKLALANVSDAGNDTTVSGRWTFTKDTNGQGIIIPNGKLFEVIVNDDLSSLTTLRMKIKGKLVQSCRH